MARSLTAEINAFFRARETRRAEPQRILADEWAHALHPADLRFQAIRYARFVIPPLNNLVEELQTAHCVRHASVDKLLLQAVDEGYTQIVLLGAGNDMRRSRFADRLSHVKWFEVDRAAQLAHKKKNLSNLPNFKWEAVPVECELLDPSLLQKLEAAGLDSKQKTLYVLEGVIHYLPQAEAEALLKRLSHGRLILSFIQPQMVEQGKGLFGQLWGLTAEIPITFFNPDGLGKIGETGGWKLRQSWDFKGQVQTFVPEAGNRGTARYQDVAYLDKE
jgi:methyltransferase (TIGR00027 family)